MKKSIILFILGITFNGFSQKTWTTGNDFWSGKCILENNQKISISEAIEKVKDQEELVKKLQSAKSNRTIGAILSYPGAFAFGYTLGLSLGSKEKRTVEPNWAVGGIGAGMMVGGMIIMSRGNKLLDEAVNDYNNLKNKADYFNPEISIQSNENGLGFRLTF